jgi:uncharacterized membrane protein YhiD involved in acid resistance
MAGLGNLEDFLLNQPAQISIPYLIVSLIVAAGLAYILSNLYVRYGTSISNRKKFAGNFVLLTTTTTLIITVVKSSLALSLGLVGALSIVRFRAAIKEPEELAFLFLAIAIGLGLGANQLAVTLVSFVIISIIIYGRHTFHKKTENQNLFLTISGKSSKDFTLNNLVEILNRNSISTHLKRYDKINDGTIEASFLIDLKNFKGLENIRHEIEKLSKNVSITYLDQTGAH